MLTIISKNEIVGSSYVYYKSEAILPSCYCRLKNFIFSHTIQQSILVHNSPAQGHIKHFNFSQSKVILGNNSEQTVLHCTFLLWMIITYPYFFIFSKYWFFKQTFFSCTLTISYWVVDWVLHGCRISLFRNCGRYLKYITLCNLKCLRINEPGTSKLFFFPIMHNKKPYLCADTVGC